MVNLFDSGIINVIFGDNVKIVRPVNLYGCTLSNNVFIGPFCEIQKDSFIGEGTKVHSHSFICELVTIGKNCFIGHGVKFVNDKFSKGTPANGDKTLWIKTRIGDNVSIGSNATILPVKIANGVVVGAGSVVTKDLNTKGIYAGNPAILIKTLL